jgi:hypothetical protein
VLSRRFGLLPRHEELDGPALLKVSSRLSALSLLYPWLLVVGHYALWLIAALDLNHPPRPSIDDPKYLGTPIPLLTQLLAVSISISPGLLLLGPLGCAWWIIQGHRGGTKPKTLALGSYCLVLVVSWGLFIGWARQDPGRVVEWFMD